MDDSDVDNTNPPVGETAPPGPAVPRRLPPPPPPYVPPQPPPPPPYVPTTSPPQPPPPLPPHLAMPMQRPGQWALPQIVYPAPAPKPTVPLEWSDRIHPCIVLEIQRMLRGRFFITFFLALQAVMLITTAIAASTPGKGTEWMEASHYCFWVAAGMMLMVVLPVTSLFALGEDLRSGSLELLFFTRMGPGGMVWGKWLSKVAQAALMSSTLMPYLVLHYFATGVNPLWELMILAGMLYSSACMCAVGTAVSLIRSVLLRFGAVICIVMASYFLSMTLMLIAMLIVYLIVHTLVALVSFALYLGPAGGRGIGTGGEMTVLIVQSLIVMIIYAFIYIYLPLSRAALHLYVARYSLRERPKTGGLL